MRVAAAAAQRHYLHVDPLSLALLQVDWGSLDHAYGQAGDAPRHLLALVSDDPQARSRAVGYLDAAILHQGSVFSATAPFIKIAATLLADPRTAVPVADILPWDPEPRSLRVSLLDYLAVFAEACQLEIPDEHLLRDAYPAGRRDKADLLACRDVVPDVFEAVLPLVTGSDAAVRTSAMTVATYCLDHAALADRRASLAELLADTAAVSPQPRERAAVARLLGMLGHRPEALLNDEHPGVRACAALAPELSGDARAIRELISALEAPLVADQWFTGHLPGQEFWLHCDLATALAAQADDLEAVLPAALGLATVSNEFTYDRDLAPFVRLAFPQPLTEDSVLTPAQRAFLSALLANGHKPFDEAVCRALLGT
jgi:hypothetical protein